MAFSTLPLLVLVWIELVKSEEGATPPFQDVIALIFNVQDHFQNGCIILYSSLKSMFETREEIQLAFELRKSKVKNKESLAVIVVSNTEDENKNIMHKCKNPLRILPRSSREKKFMLQLANERGRAVSTWLQFLDSSTKLDKFFDGVDIPFDCEFLVAQRSQEAVTLTEVYRVQGDLPLQRFHFGAYKPKLGLKVTELKFHERRNNLKGIEMKTCVIHDPPTIVIQRPKHNPKLTGFFGMLYHELERRLNFTTNFTIVTDGLWGKLINGTWNGNVGRIERREVDMCANDYVINKDMLDVLDHTIAIYTRNYHVFIPLPSKKAFKWTQFFDPFTKALWTTIACTVVAFALYISFVNGIGLRYGRERQDNINHFTPTQSLFCMISIFMQQGHSTVPDTASARGVYIIALLTSLIVMAAYNAILVSFLSIHNVELPFTDIKGLLAHPKFKVGGYGVPMDYRVANESAANSDDDLNLLAAKIKYYKKEGPPKSVWEGLDRVCRTKKYAFLIPEDSAMDQRANISCEIEPLPDAKFKGALFLVMTKNNPYKSLFNDVLQKLLTGGIITRLHEQSRGQRLTGSQTFDMEVYLEDVTPVLALLAVSMVAAFALLTLERNHYKRKSRSSQVHQLSIGQSARFHWLRNRTISARRRKLLMSGWSYDRT